MNAITRTMINLAAFAAITAGVSLAQTDSFVIDVPFSFVVGSKTMPAGHYTILTDYTSAVWLRDFHKAVSAVTESQAGERPGNTSQSAIAFRVHDSRYYLAWVYNSVAGSAKEITETRAEKEVERASARTTYATLVAKK